MVNDILVGLLVALLCVIIRGVGGSGRFYGVQGLYGYLPPPTYSGFQAFPMSRNAISICKTLLLHETLQVKSRKDAARPV